MSREREEIAERRARLAPGAAVGVDEAMIGRLVHALYADVRTDPMLGPIFENAIEDWEEHLARLCDFWSSVMLMTGRDKGQPMAAHARLPGLTPAHFERWLALFEVAALRVCPSSAAAVFSEKARMIARSLQLSIGTLR